MKTITEQEVRADFEKLVSAGRAEPVEIMRDGERVGLWLSDADASLIEDLLLAQRAAEARREGTIGLEASTLLLASIRDASH
jgi:hypothetical protein